MGKPLSRKARRHYARMKAKQEGRPWLAIQDFIRQQEDARFARGPELPGEDQVKAFIEANGVKRLLPARAAGALDAAQVRGGGSLVNRRAK